MYQKSDVGTIFNEVSNQKLKFAVNKALKF